MTGQYLYNGHLALINLFIWAILIICYRKGSRTLVCSEHINYKPYQFIGFATILYCVFAFAEADTYHLHEAYDLMYQTGKTDNIEPFYLWTIQVLPHSYYFWRLIIWGAAVLILIHTFKLLSLDGEIFGYILPITLLPFLSQTRGSLGFVVLLWAMVLLFEKQYRQKILGVCLLISSYYLHKSIPVFLLFIPIAAIMPFNKKAFIISLLFFPFLYLFVNIIAENLLGFQLLGQITIDKGESYLNRSNEDYNTTGMLFNIIECGGILLSMLVSTKYYLSKKHSIDTRILFIHKYAYISLYIAMLFFGQEMSNFLHTRVLHFAMFSLVITLTYYYQNNSRKKIDSFILLLLFISSLKEIAYHVYKWW